MWSTFDLSVSYLISSKHLVVENIAHDWSFQHCTWLYLTVPGSALGCHDLPFHILPLTGLNAFVYTGLNVQKLLVDGMGRMVISVSTSSKSFKKMGAEVNTLANP